ncbi:nitroreductase [Rhodoferax sp. GW822-FHT02A01]|uniref:nitroreductase family protein n=1 Tax=Rhodoferax sp. GW822-FHT02A01 TaxID=3141537 RepID=UPI00315C79DE
MPDIAGLLSQLLQSRQTILPKRLMAPGPDADQLVRILEAAAHAPDHGQLLPWRLVVIAESERAALGTAFADALAERDPAALPEQLQQARDKAMRAPLLLMLVVEDARGDAEIDLLERVVSAGCAVQNMLLMATALGFASALTSGKALKSSSLRSLFGLGARDHAICFLSVGTAQRAKAARVRPTPDQYVSYLSTESR